MQNTINSADIKVNNTRAITNKVTNELCRLLFKQLPYAIIAQLLVATLFVIGYRSVQPSSTLTIWFGYLLSVSFYWALVVTLYQFKRSFVNTRMWVFLYGIGTFFSGVAWGFVALSMLPAEISPLQIYIVGIILGMTAGANPFFNPIISVYLSFLTPAFIPLAYWFFTQGGIFFYLGLCSIVYFGVMVLCCYLANYSLRESARLRFQNIDLDSLNQILEKRVEERTSELEKYLAITKSTLESTADGILVVDNLGQIEYVNQKFIDMWSISEDIVEEGRTGFFFHLVETKVAQPSDFLAMMSQINEQPDLINNGEFTLNDGRIFEWYSQPHIVREEINGRVWSFSDMSIRKKMEYQLAYQASHDTLTDLPNRSLLLDRIGKGMLYADRFHSNLIVMFLDIDNFKMINDNLGHDNGDLILKTIAKRLKKCIRKSDTVARIGGDEFVILFFANDKANIINMAHHLLEEVTKPIYFSDHEVVATTSIGVCIYPYDGTDSSTLLKHADMAMYAAKSQGKNSIKLFDDSIRAYAQKTLSYQMDLRNALKKGQFTLVYQPFIDLSTLEIIGCESLIRWQHPRDGLLYPSEFLRIAEQSGLFNDIGNWVIEEACRQNLQWQTQGLKPITMSVNISPIQFKRDDFVNIIKKILKKLNYPPNLLELELTENIIMENKKHTFDILTQLRQLQIGVSIDNFGTGYSGLNYLKQFPVTKLKIDKSFVFDCKDEENEGAIVKAIVAMGHTLNLPVLAGGIEDNDHVRYLRLYQCDMGQGFYLGKPMSADEFSELLKRQGGRHIKTG
ncbi:putative bifunctional diguanylate cyclase/phosphodiesterase [Legionella sp. W05-934-2]|jgi:diguanylate cyclase (GGDEF)-like protein|uniref:putative bifunctional diguanylate cyclase/phosphodiesterase n=1 Tax=Legionella sp. W05-934-2 TaxID=1198649 RepID=UPI0034621D71